jgi:iron(III) transport system substrate-binding protein
MVQNSAGIGRMLKGMPFKVIYPNPVTLLPRTIGIRAGVSPEVRAEAEQFVNFMLTKRGQAVAQKGDPTGDSLYYPVVAGVSALPGLPSLSGATVQSVDPSVWGPREAEIDRWFTNHIVH